LILPLQLGFRGQTDDPKMDRRINRHRQTIWTNGLTGVTEKQTERGIDWTDRLIGQMDRQAER
jgi:hypothetical protein